MVMEWVVGKEGGGPSDKIPRYVYIFQSAYPRPGPEVQCLICLCLSGNYSNLIILFALCLQLHHQFPTRPIVLLAWTLAGRIACKVHMQLRV